MGRRLGWLAGVFALGLVLVRLNRLLQSGTDLPRWDVILLAAALLGGVVWWLLSQTSLKTPAAAYLFLLCGVVVFMRVAVPTTLSFGVVPTAETMPVLGDTLTTAFRLIKSGVPPVYPEPGILGILAALLWTLGGIYSYGVITGRITAMVVPAGIVYLQFAVFDRRQAGFGWMAVSAAALGLAVTAVALNRRDHVGRARDGTGRPKTHRSTAAALAMACVVGVISVLTAGSAIGVVSEYGNLPWRTGISGSVPGSGGFALDRFVDLRQRLQSRDNSVLFWAALDEENSPPPEELYWRMETLDIFNGVEWRRGASQIRNYEPGIPIGNEEHLYQGSSVAFRQRVVISELSDERVPTAGTPTAIEPLPDDGTLAPRSFRVGRDATVFYPLRLRAHDEYQVESQFPLYEQDLGALATDPDTGELTPLFASAAAAGLFDAEPALVDPSPVSPDDLQHYRDLPEDLPAQLRTIAVRETKGASSDFEKAWMLQHWFRDSDAFEYSTNVSTGHGALVLADWLDDPESPNARTGYCEQFAAAMAVLGRLLGIPSRVVMGFTPGIVTEVNEVQVIEVRDTNAHAWVEMWMDGFGWVRFDPTPRGEFQPASITAGFNPVEYVPETPTPEIGNPVAPGIVDVPPGAIDQPLTPGSSSLRVRWGLFLIPLAALLLGIIPLTKRARRARRLRRVRDGDITPAWDEIVDRLEDMGERIDDSLTPIEFARGTDTALVSLANKYSAAIYGGKTGTAQEGDLVTAEWWMQTRYQSGRRMRGALNPRSLLRRR